MWFIRRQWEELTGSRVSVPDGESSVDQDREGSVRKVFTVKIIAINAPVQPCSLALNLREEESETKRQQRSGTCFLISYFSSCSTDSTVVYT